MMLAAEFPPDRFSGASEASGSTNPFMDYHLIYAIVLVVLAHAYAGHTGGLCWVWA
jgi:thiosulfate dehydrogenase [quinone] large subunit